MLTGQLWELYWLGLLDARATVGWEAVERWGQLVGSTLEVVFAPTSSHRGGGTTPGARA
jgi:hypothetical protein